MKTSNVGILAVAILWGVAGIGSGIAQDLYVEDRPVSTFEEQEFPQVAISPVDDMQMGNPIETGSLPAESIANDYDPFSRGGP